jgi:hypothetical protein
MQNAYFMRGMRDYDRRATVTARHPNEGWRFATGLVMVPVE